MKNKGSKLLALAAMVSVMGLGGCASTADLQKAQSTADQAQTEAQQAQSTANDAMAAAKKAQATADAAAKSADEANKASKANNEKINRMFKKAMYK